MTPGVAVRGSSRSRWLGLVPMLLALPGMWIAPPLFIAAWLAAWWWCLSLVLGSLSLLWIHRLTGGRWGEALRPAVLATSTRLPWLLPLFVPVALGLPLVYPWVADPSVVTQSMARPAFVQLWLSVPFFAARMVLYAALWWWLARGTSAAMSRGRAAGSLIVHTVFTSLAAVDLLASLVPAWSSSAFGLLSLISQLLAGSAFVVGLTASLRAHRIPPPEKSAPPVWRDLGNLLLMGVALWGYLSFMQFLIIWAENLPREISWYVPRLQTGWHGVGVALVLVNLVLPLLALLMRGLKDKPQRLRWLAAGLLAASALDAVWMVLPSVDPHSVHGWWLCPLLFAGIGWTVFGGVGKAVAEAPDERSTTTATAATPPTATPAAPATTATTSTTLAKAGGSK